MSPNTTLEYFRPVRIPLIVSALIDGRRYTVETVRPTAWKEIECMVEDSLDVSNDLVAAVPSK